MSSTYLPYSDSKSYTSVLVFPSTRECEQDFSATMNIKTKSKNRFTSTSHNFRCAVSTVAPRINLLVQKKKKKTLATITLIGLLLLFLELIKINTFTIELNVICRGDKKVAERLRITGLEEIIDRLKYS